MLDLSTYCRIIAVLGLGMAQISPIYAPMVNGGSIYQWSRAGNRDIELVLDFNGANPGDVAQKISAVQKAFDATSNKYGQPTRMMLVGYNAAGTVEQSETVFVDVAYRGGLEGGFTNYYHERKNVQLLNFTPALRAEGYTTAALDWQDSLTGDCVVRVGADGTIDNAGVTVTTTEHTGRVMAKDNAGGLYLGGTFADLNGVAAADNIAYKAAGGTWVRLEPGWLTRFTALKSVTTARFTLSDYSRTPGQLQRLIILPAGRVRRGRVSPRAGRQTGSRAQRCSS